VLLVLVLLLPAACVLWFLNEAVITQSAAARQRVLEAYRGQLRLVRSRIDGHWRAEAARLNSTANPGQQFARLMLDGVADGVVLLHPDGRVSYPNDAPASADVAAIERQISTTDRLDDVAAKLNDYTSRLTGSERLTLMTRLRQLEPNVSLPTEAALRLSMELIAAERPVSSPGGGLRETALRDIWALTSDDGRVIALYRTGRLESMMHDYLHQVTPAGIVFLAYPPDVIGGAEAIAAGPWMPGWQLSFQPLDMTPFDAAARRQVMLYISVAVGGIVVMVITGAAAGRALRRQMRLARLKTDLVAAVSHELRTPLASMRVLVDGLLADRLDPAKTREYLNMMAGENERLSRLIENFLAFSRLDRDQYRFVFAEVEPSSVVNTAMDAIRDRIPAACNLAVDVAPALPTLMADSDALVTALVNLLDNAIKYTPTDKQIVVRAYRDGETFVSFVVQDNGVGIPVREQRRIFRRFYRVDQRLTQNTGGVGLGLSIVELIARGHRGSVSVRSAPGAGSTFVLRLPALGQVAS
jgi:signal transduction histidine kinase